MNFELLETERLILRKITPATYDHLFSNEDDEACMEFLGLDRDGMLKEKEKWQQGLETHDRTFVIFQLLLKESKEVIGATGFVRYYPLHSRAELGYAITKEKYKGKGYMHEACVPMIPYGFEQLKLIRMEAFAGPGNVPSIKILEKLGFEKEGLMRKHYVRNGIAEDSAIYSIIKS